MSRRPTVRPGTDPAPGGSAALEPGPEDASTGELLARWRLGNRAALEQLTGAHSALLLARARAHPLRNHLQNRPDPADLVNDALVRALASGLLERFEQRGPGSLRNVLFRVLDRTIQDALRAERAGKRAPNGALGSGDEDGAEPAGPAEHAVDHREPSPTSEARSKEWVERCRAILPAREWEVWSRVELEGYAPAEVAAALELGESAARGLLFRARARILGELLEREDPDGR